MVEFNRNPTLLKRVRGSDRRRTCGYIWRVGTDRATLSPILEEGNIRVLLYFTGAAEIFADINVIGGGRGGGRVTLAQVQGAIKTYIIQQPRQMQGILGQYFMTEINRVLNDSGSIMQSGDRAVYEVVLVK
jgi:hypothetical protein